MEHTTAEMALQKGMEYGIKSQQMSSQSTSKIQSSLALLMSDGGTPTSV